MLVTVALVPFIVYQMFPPTTKETSEAKMSVKHYADEELNKMGPLSSVEKRAMAFFVLILALFIAISFTTIDLAFVAVLAMILAVMPPFEIVTPKDALNYVEWGVVLWLGAAISIGSIGASTGVFKALTQLIFVKSGIVAVPVTLFVILLVLIMMYFHAISPGYVAYTVALVPITLEMVKAVHFANPALLGFLVIFTMGAGAAFFPFNSAPNLFFYGYGYYNEREFLKGGLVLSVITILNILLLFFLWWPLVGI
jgi:DASS family divalent anion:Na+ symporter